MNRGDAIAAAARSLVGTRFRLHGRNPASGLDCIGLVAEALRRAGCDADPPRGYALRNADIAAHLGKAAASGLKPVDDAVRAGDVLLCIPGPGQHHLAIATGPAGFIHAHAGLGRLVETLGALPGPTTGHWRHLQGGC